MGKIQHADQVYSVLSDSTAAARSPVSASWSRSIKLYGLDPECAPVPRGLSQFEFNLALERSGPLVKLAQEILDQLFYSVGDAGCCVLLTDHEGVLLDRRGKVCDDADFHRVGLWTGMVWNEAAEGTNGIGTCLAEERSLTSHRDQHFMTCNTGLTCSATPIRNAQGKVAAVLDISHCRSDTTPAMVKLIESATFYAAQRIEARYFRDSFHDARILVAPECGRWSDGLIAVDKQDLVIGASYAARRAFGLTDKHLAHPFPIGDLLDNHVRTDDFAEAERGAIQRALSRTQGNVSAAARLLGISRATLHRKIARLNPSREQQPRRRTSRGTLSQSCDR